VTPFAVLREITAGLPEHQHITSKSQRDEWQKLAEEAKEELNSWLTAMIQEIIVGDTEALIEIHQKYIDNLMALKEGRKLWDESRGEIEPDTGFLEGIEAEARKTDQASREQFRTKIINAVARRAIDLARDPRMRPFGYDSDEVLFQAYKNYLFKLEQKTIDWQALVSKKVIGEQASRRLAAVRKGLTSRGCCETCASVFISHVAGIFTRGQAR
jgi:predicted Ser/Thr protein kinase